MSDEAPARDPPIVQVLAEAGIISQLVFTHAARILAPELNLPQFALLNHLVRLGGEWSLVRLAGAMQVTKAAMTNTVGRLADKGYLEVRPDPADGRGKLVRLTPAGSEARAQALARLSTALAPLTTQESPETLAASLATLRRLRTWLDANRGRNGGSGRP